MSKKSPPHPSDYIVPLNINGLEGRMVRLPADKDRTHKEILFVYGHHSSLERWWGVMLALSHYGNVTMPDLPGFGGMDSFYSVGKKPTIDNLADYLASFVKLRYKRKRIVIAGMSFGFVVVTRMLERFPELTPKVEMLVSIVGFAHKDDFTFSKPRYYGYLYTARLLSFRIPATIFRGLALNSFTLRHFYGKTHNAKHKFEHLISAEERQYFMNFEIGLWQENDVRTNMYTTVQLLQFDNCQAQVKLPVWHVAASADGFFDTNIIEQHMRIIFTDFHLMRSSLVNHAPSVIADEKTATALLPRKLRQVLKSL